VPRFAHSAARFGAALCLLASSVLLSSRLEAAWTTPFRVSVNPAGSYTETDGGRNVLVEDGAIRVVWADTRTGNPEIWFRENPGTGWLAETPLTNDSGTSHHPAIGQPEPGVLRVVWEDDRTGHPEIWNKYRTAGTWSADSCLTCDEFESSRPALDWSGLHLVWEETRDGNREIYYQGHFDDGSFEEVRLSDDPAESSHPAVSSARIFPAPFNPVVGVAWQDFRHGNWEIYSNARDNMGWLGELRVSNGSGSSVHPSVIAEYDFCGDVIFPIHRVAWQDDQGGTDQIWLAEGDGFYWNGGPLTTSSTPSRHPSLGQSIRFVYTPFGIGRCPTPVVVWEEITGGAGAIRLIDFTEAGDPLTLSLPSSDASDPVISIDNNFPSGGILEKRYEVVWTDLRDGNPEIYETGDSIVVNVTATPEIVPGAAELLVSAAAPNPFRSATRVSVTLPEAAAVEARVVDAAGRTVRALTGSPMTAGTHDVVWDGRDARGAPAAAGTYFVVVETGEERRARVVTLIR